MKPLQSKRLHRGRGQYRLFAFALGSIQLILLLLCNNNKHMSIIHNHAHACCIHACADQSRYSTTGTHKFQTKHSDAHVHRRMHACMHQVRFIDSNKGVSESAILRDWGVWL